MSTNEPLAHEVWALALGGTRRAYIANGGVLAALTDLDAYFVWIEAAQRALLARLFARGIHTLIAVGRIPGDRGAGYADAARQGVLSSLFSPQRRAFYADQQVQVCIAADHAQIGAALCVADFAAQATALATATRGATDKRLIYLLRGPWVDAAEEAQFGFQLGHHLGRLPTHAELVHAYYGTDVSPLTVYIGSGRPQLTFLRPPFLYGREDCYWSATSPVLLTDADWERIITDHTQARRTTSARAYPVGDQGRADLRASLARHHDIILGVGQQNAFGSWEPIVEKR